jgi:hypothetical protein
MSLLSCRERNQKLLRVSCCLLDVSSEKPAASRLKQSPRPDIVANSVIDEHSANEIARLEILCEAKTKELTALRNELCERLRWFEAMAVVVGYFVSKVGFFLFTGIAVSIL